MLILVYKDNDYAPRTTIMGPGRGIPALLLWAGLPRCVDG